jgi:predicted phosphodiesterase
MKSKSEIAREYRLEYPDKPTKALARVMYNENKLLFRDTEDARFALRYIEGKAGAKNKQFSINVNPDFVIEEPRPMNPYKLPESDETSYDPYILKGHKKLAVFSDIHVPYHSISAITAALSLAKKEKVDALLLNGDSIDCHLLSMFLKDPRQKRFAEELKILTDLISVFRKTLKCKIYYKIGNHEERYEHYLMMKAGELIGVEEFEFKNILKKRMPDIEVIGDKRIVMANALPIVHGHEFGKGFFNPVNVARGLSLRSKMCAVQGHSHQVSENPDKSLVGEILTTWSVGCLCELHPKWLPINKWGHGVMIIELDKNGRGFHVRNYRIDKGKIL